MLRNELVLFYDEYPSDLLQPDRNKNAFFGTLISHKAIDENSMGGDEILRKFLEDPDLLSVSVCIEKTGILKNFLKHKFVGYEGGNGKSIYNTRNFVWCSVFSMCFGLLYKSVHENPPIIRILYDPKSLNESLKYEFTTYFEKDFIEQIRQITRKYVPSSLIQIANGNKKMLGVQIADRKVRDNYRKYPDLRQNGYGVKNITENVDAILINLIEKGLFSDEYDKL
jgi:hypothetical protein